MQMLKNHLKVTFRKLRTNLGSSLLNILGLTLGVMGAIILFLTVKYELSFDEFHQNHAEIYRVTNNYYYPTFTMHVGQTPDPMAAALETDFTVFEKVAAISSHYNNAIAVGQETFESDLIYCGPEFIQMFDFYNNPDQWIIGDPNEILKEVNKTILTKSFAETLFKDAKNAIGQIIELNDETPIEIAGIIQDPPGNTNYPFDQLVSQPTYKKIARESFGSVSSTTTFVQLPANVSVESIRPALDEFNEKYMEAAWGDDFVTIDLQPLTEIHHDERFSSNNYITNKANLWALGLIGFFLIIIACINFVNLATAKAIGRSKEIGIRKILGSSKANIIGQFMSESFVLGLVAIVLGTILAQNSFPYFSELTQLNIGNGFYYSTPLVLFLIGLVFFIPLIIGLYPAVMLSKFESLDIIHAKKAASNFQGITLRRGLITFQLMTAQVLVIGALVITYQLQFFQNKDLGFDEESMLAIDFHGSESVEKQLELQRQIKNLSFVKNATLTSSIPMSGHHSSSAVTSVDSDVDERFNAEFIYADNAYVESMDFKVLAGKSTLTEIEQDSVRGFVVNQTLINRLNFGSPEEAVGKRINLHGYQARIIGVVEDFHTVPLYEGIKPVGIIYGKKDYNALGIRYQNSDIKNSIAQLEEAWSSIFPDKTFNYYFMDEQLGDIYENEVRFSKIINAFTIISLIIACIGLIGLSAFSSINRTKEIGIRKVLGASVSNILVLLSREFMVLSLISFFIGIPVAFYLTKYWLEGFAYSIELEWWMLMIAGVSTVIITLITVVLQSLNTALTNPVQSLRSE